MEETIELPRTLHEWQQAQDSTFVLKDNGEVWHKERAELLGWLRSALTLNNLKSAVAQMQGQDYYANAEPGEA